MLFIELLVPWGIFTVDERRRLAERMTAQRLLGGENGEHSADSGVIMFFDSLTHVVVREVETWVTAGRTLAPHRGPRYVVNVYVGAWAKEMSGHLITGITRQLGENEGDPDRLFRESRAVVHVLGISEGSYGLYGKAQRSSDMLEMINSAKVASPEQAPKGMTIDPVCGAKVPIEAATMLELDGVTYGFCCTHCRGHFVKRRQKSEGS
ncbi:hypothetical protein [Microbispora sp. ATCC PTA-5024]|uniref:hypothetical protein n=1 Tax=Microbispora sp. ATCC PTA-5024 TaxID=316330 RepID=UPI0003DD7FAD|nr:hypothetical protein [Microbispora sp. ATCC PTA-5024]ETK32762.1 hypothetical protein MPTA5024_28085 [Microbispora sp. ATCC PTA-5024]